MNKNDLKVGMRVRALHDSAMAVRVNRPYFRAGDEGVILGIDESHSGGVSVHIQWEGDVYLDGRWYSFAESLEVIA